MQVATSQHFSVLMASLLLITSITTPLIKLLYNPNRRYVSTKHRTVEHLKPNYPFRLVACVHNEDHVTPIIDLLEAINPNHHSPLMLYLIHLTELAGRAAAILRPHKKPKSSSSSASQNNSPTDHIVNAFRYFENQHPSNAVSLNPFIAISPISTMHNDVCSLAFDKKTLLIILPFHKYSDGAREMSRASLQSFNCNVLDFAPCSVAILVERGAGVTCARTNHLLQRAVVYFLGGADDREAVSIAARMAGGGISVTVVRFRMRGVAAEDEDDRVIGEARMRCEGVVYMERVVEDGEGTVGVVREMSDEYDLVVVGRRKGVESGLMRGLSAWSECPELGILGDMLAGTEFGGKVSILVVKQQERVKNGNGEEKVGERCAFVKGRNFCRERR